MVVTMNGAFAVAVLYIFLRVGSEPSTLIGAWFTFRTGELWVLAGIKRKELHINKKGDDERNAKV